MCEFAETFLKKYYIKTKTFKQPDIQASNTPKIISRVETKHVYLVYQNIRSYDIKYKDEKLKSNSYLE